MKRGALSIRSWPSQLTYLKLSGGEAFQPQGLAFFAPLNASNVLHLLILIGAQLLRQVAQGQRPHPSLKDCTGTPGQNLTFALGKLYTNFGIYNMARRALYL